MDDILKEAYKGVMDGDVDTVETQTRKALDGGIGPEVLLNDVLIPAMDEVGQKFEAGDFFVPDLMFTARAMQAGLAIVKPKLLEKDIKPIGRVLIGTVKGDQHDIGKNLVAMMLEGAGFEILDIGVDVSPEAFVEGIKDNQVDIVAMSALLTTTMPMMKTNVDAINEAGLRDAVKIIVGGAQVNQAYAEEIGADGSAPDAAQAAKLARSLVGK